MKTRALLTMVCMALCVQLWGEEFNVGDAKYKVRPDGKVELKEYKKAQGEVVLTSTVSDPKTGRQYTLASVGKEAFKKSGVTKVVLPESLESSGLGKGAFKECASLEYVELPTSLEQLPDEAFRGCKSLKNVNDSSIVVIGDFAYRGCNLSQWGIPASVKAVKYGAFMDNPNMKTVFVESADKPILFNGNVFFGCPLETVIVDRDIYLSNGAEVEQNRPFNNNPALTYVVVGPNVTGLRSDFFEGCPSLKAIRFYNLDEADRFRDALRKVDSNVQIYLDDDDTPRKISNLDQIVKFRKSIAKFVNAMNDGTGCSVLDGSWSGFNFNNVTMDFLKENISDFHRMLYYLGDVIIDEWEVPFKESQCANAAFAVANRLFETINIENDGFRQFVNDSDIRQWAKSDALRREVGDTTHMHDYEILLGLSEKLLKSDPKENIYACAMQLAGLCGMGRWQEAAAYYPAAHRLITENGKYGVPYELTYMRDVINQHGYTAKDPVYSKNTTKGKGGKSNKGGSGYKNSDLLEYFFEKGYQKYKEHRDYRRWKKWIRKNGRIK